jgi:hypothetical protein
MELLKTNYYYYYFRYRHNVQFQKKNFIIQINGIKPLITGNDSVVKVKG